MYRNKLAEEGITGVVASDCLLLVLLEGVMMKDDAVVEAILEEDGGVEAFAPLVVVDVTSWITKGC
jgi:hypothetical protein